jgi:hypothetical protein
MFRTIVRLVKLGHQVEKLLAALEDNLDRLSAEHFRVELLAIRGDTVNGSLFPQYLAWPGP